MNRKEEMELLPCPFCGGEANITRFISRDTPIQPIEITHIQCVNDDYCHVSVDIQHINEAVAVAAWNTRAALRASAAPGPLDEWIEREFAGHGRAIRTKDEPAYAGEPYMSMADAKESTRRAVAAFASAALDEGMVLMPREATRAMTMAGCDHLPSCEHVFGHAGEILRNAYRKMVAVAALAPATEGGGREEIAYDWNFVRSALETLSNPADIKVESCLSGAGRALAIIEVMRSIAQTAALRLPPSPSPSVGTGTQQEVVGQHLSWLFLYMQTINEKNWRDTRDNAIRQLEQLSLMFPGRAGIAQPSAHREAPHD